MTAAATATKDKTAGGVPKAATSIGELSQIELANKTLSEAWDQLGYFAKIKVQKQTLVTLCNLEGMPLSCVDVIPTQDGPKLYINSEGAKYNRDKYLNAQNREVAGRTIDILDTVPGAKKAEDEALGRKYFRVVTHVMSEEYRKIIDAISKGVVPVGDGMKLIEEIKKMNMYTSFSAFSYQAEKLNKTPEQIIKKGITQAHRRADLEISKQFVLPADEEPIDAQFVVRDTAAAAEHAAAAAAGGGGAPTLTPSSVKDVTPKNDPKKPDTMKTEPAKTAKADEKPAQDAAPAAEQKPPQKTFEQLGAELNAKFALAGLGKVDRQRWMNHYQIPASKEKLQQNPALLEKAVELVTKQYEDGTLVKWKGGVPQDPPAEPLKQAELPVSPDKEDPERKKLLGVIFGDRREKAGFDSEDHVRTWVKLTWGKGLSDMTTAETKVVADRMGLFSGLLLRHAKWGFSSPAELVNYVQEAQGADFYKLDEEGLKKLEVSLEDLGV